MSQEQYTKILQIAAKLVTTMQLSEDVHDWIVASGVKMRQRRHMVKIASRHNAELRSAAIELRNAIQGR